MLGTMMNVPLTITALLRRAGMLFAKTEIVSRLPDKGIVRSNYGEVYRRSRALAAALAGSGVQRGDRVATLMWNHHWHLEAYFGVPAAGAVLQTLNLRLHPDELAYIANHAEDRVLIVDDVLLPLYEKFCSKSRFERVLVVPTRGIAAHSTRDGYESFLESGSPEYEFPEIEENEAAAMCYTSGTTGLPKGVVYSHRSMVLHTFSAALPDNHGLGQRDCVLPAVPMFHVLSWGMPYAAAMTGTKLVLPGQHLDALSLLDLFEQEQVTHSAGVPTIWMRVLEELDRQPGNWKLHPGLRINAGGSAINRELICGLGRHRVSIRHAWGMTETGPLASVCELKPFMREWPEEQRLEIEVKQGLPVPMTDARVANESGEVPWDGETMGELQVRGPWVAASYYKPPEKNPEQSQRWTADGWFCTGDVVTIDSEGYIRIADRTKDLIKSGGEWISSVDLENALMCHPAVFEAAVIAVPHPKWSERPLAAVVLKQGAEATAGELLAHLAGSFAAWQLPDAIVFVAEIPRTSVGKMKKSQLRQMFPSWEWAESVKEKK
jgi:fatty-acyl-CoA synthase